MRHLGRTLLVTAVLLAPLTAMTPASATPGCTSSVPYVSGEGGVTPEQSRRVFVQRSRDDGRHFTVPLD